MPLRLSAPRTEIHQRHIEMHAFRRDDGLYDVEGHLTDRKPVECTVPFGATVPAGRPVHEMWIRLTIDDTFAIRGAVAATDAAPYGDCLDAPATLATLVGANIGSGWTRLVKERLGGTKSCTHLMEMLIPMGTAAIQAMWQELGSRPEPIDATGRPLLIDSCWALASNKGLASRRWPIYYTGPSRIDQKS